MGFEKIKALVVMAVVSVYVGVKRSRIDQKGYRETSRRRISSIRSATSSRPLRAAFAASSVRLPPPPRWASIASLVSSEIVCFLLAAS